MRAVNFLTGFIICSFNVFASPTNYKTQDSTKFPYLYQNIKSESDEISNFAQIHQHKQSYHISARIAKDMKSLLNALIENLKKFVERGNFDSKSFEQSADVMKKQLSEIAFWIANLPSLDEDILYQFDFAEDMLEAMTRSVITLNFYCASCKDGQALVSEIIKFNVVLFCLFDINGTPDSKHKDYSTRVLQFAPILRLLGKAYGLLHEKLPGVVLGFENEYYSALETLRVLACYIPKEDHAYRFGSELFPSKEYDLNQ